MLFPQLLPHLCRFTKRGILIHEQIHCDITGKVVRATENSDQAISELEQKYRKRPVAIGWHECRQLLFDQLPPSTVEFDKQVFLRIVHQFSLDIPAHSMRHVWSC